MNKTFLLRADPKDSLSRDLRSAVVVRSEPSLLRSVTPLLRTLQGAYPVWKELNSISTEIVT